MNFRNKLVPALVLACTMLTPALLTAGDLEDAINSTSLAVHAGTVNTPPTFSHPGGNAAFVAEFQIVFDYLLQLSYTFAVPVTDTVTQGAISVEVAYGVGPLTWTTSDYIVIITGYPPLSGSSDASVVIDVSAPRCSAYSWAGADMTGGSADSTVESANGYAWAWGGFGFDGGSAVAITLVSGDAFAHGGDSMSGTAGWAWSETETGDATAVGGETVTWTTKTGTGGDATAKAWLAGNTIALGGLGWDFGGFASAESFLAGNANAIGGEAGNGAVGTTSEAGDAYAYTFEGDANAEGGFADFSDVVAYGGRADALSDFGKATATGGDAALMPGIGIPSRAGAAFAVALASEARAFGGFGYWGGFASADGFTFAFALGGSAPNTIFGIGNAALASSGNGDAVAWGGHGASDGGWAEASAYVNADAVGGSGDTPSYARAIAGEVATALGGSGIPLAGGSGNAVGADAEAISTSLTGGPKAFATGGDGAGTALGGAAEADGPTGHDGPNFASGNPGATASA